MSGLVGMRAYRKAGSDRAPQPFGIVVAASHLHGEDWIILVLTYEGILESILDHSVAFDPINAPPVPTSLPGKGGHS